MAAAVVSSGARSRHDAAFTSVFPAPNFTTPTPETTPQLGVLASPGRPFGGFNIQGDVTNDAVRFNRAWSTATRYLSLPPGRQQQHKGGKSITNDVQEAICSLCVPPASRKELVVWYLNEMGVHFRQFVLPELSAWQQLVPFSKATEAIVTTLSPLQEARNLYLTPTVSLVVSAHTAGATEAAEAIGSVDFQVKRAWHSLVLNSLPQQRVQKTLACAFFQAMQQSLAKNSDPEICDMDGECRCIVTIESLPLRVFDDLGFGGSLGERAFAHAVHKLLAGPALNRHCFYVDYGTQQSVVSKLTVWVARQVAPFVERTLATLTGNKSFRLTENDVQQFEKIAVSNLARQRTASLFDFVKIWPVSEGAFLDIKECIASHTAEKAFVCTNFAEQISRRLLHAGASTAEILSIYTSVIHAFRLLDSRGVMLEKVAGSMRSYLRTRDDTVSIIAASFLADVDEDGGVLVADAAKVCPDITLEVSKSTVEDTHDHKMMDWDDMNWMPDPIDAGPEYKASKSEDVIAYILGLFDPEEFIKEVTNVLAQHLLHATDPEFVKETKLIELFKSRLDASKLQAAEVMLKDVRDSVSLNKRINPQSTLETNDPPQPREIRSAIPEEGITLQSLYRPFERRITQGKFIAALKLVGVRRNDLYFPKRTRLSGPDSAEPNEVDDTSHMDYKVRVLSGFFWPQMRSNDFALPAVFAEIDASFGNRFARLGNQRKLHFRKALARVTVDLELEDRHVRETDVPAWRASVIDAFGSADYDLETGLTAEQLSEALEMEEELVLDAISFWTSKRVLYQTAPGSYAVLERLDMDTGTAQAQTQHQQAEAVSAVMSQDALLRESAPMFETYIKGMLRDGGPKEVGGFMGVTNMLKMVLPTFTYGEDEVRWLLGEMEGKGVVVRNGEMWAFAG